MPTNVEKFNEELEKATKHMTEQNLVEFHMMVCFEAFRRIVMRTPVDTGRARGNWQIGINAEPTNVLENFNDPTGKEMLTLQSVQPFSTVYITNNVFYIWYLEYERRSKQSPEGMVEITIQELYLEFRNRT